MVLSDKTIINCILIAENIRGRRVLCKHRERNTFEVPGGHREPGEDIFATAKRELYEETGAIAFDIKPVCVYSVLGQVRAGVYREEESFGMLYYAEITSFEEELHSEIEKIYFFEELPTEWTYPLIQPS